MKIGDIQTKMLEFIKLYIPQAQTLDSLRAKLTAEIETQRSYLQGNYISSSSISRVVKGGTAEEQLIGTFYATIEKGTRIKKEPNDGNKFNSELIYPEVQEYWLPCFMRCVGQKQKKA